ncbi:MAG: dihydroorotase [Deltaproteobacteria bacterium]|jgi:dihydroorotase|nr:dihydroorotase [Deltaproteobacteria bacterium]
MNSGKKFVLRGALRQAADGSGDKPHDLLIVDGKVARLAPGAIDAPSDATVEDAGGKRLFASFIDAHAHLREPGHEYKEDIASGLAAATRGGFGAVLPMANTNPVNDCAAVTRFMLEQAAKTHPHGPRLYPVGALSVGLAGKELAPMGELAAAGAVAISNDGRGVQNAELFRRAMEYAATWGLKIIDHCEDEKIASGWQMNESGASADAGLKGQPGVGEAVQVARDILLAEYLNLPVHLAHISSRQSVELIRWAKGRGIPVTAETCPHYVLLDDAGFPDYNTAFKVSPPLRTAADVRAVLEGVRDGVIDIMVTDHAPHAAHEKEVPFDEAPKGFIGLETALALTCPLFDPAKLEQIWSRKTAEIFGLRANGFAPGDPADFFLFDPALVWEVNRENIYSKSLNTPWLGQKLQGRVVAHWLNGFKLF